MAEFRMPSLGADMDAGTLAAWKVKPGDPVKRGDIIAEVETAKGVIEIEVFEDGIVDQILTEIGVQVPVGEVIAVIRGEGEPASAPVKIEQPPAKVEVAAPAPQAAVAVPEIKPVEVPAGDRIRISPLAAKVAAELGVNIHLVQGSGPGGAITRKDIEQAAQGKQLEEKLAPAPVVAAPPVKPVEPVAKPPVEEVKPALPTALPPAPAPAAPPVAEKKPAMDFQTAMRQAIAAAMSKANREIPHYYLETRIDMSRALRWLEEENGRRTIKDRLLPVLLLLKATARALVDVPELNGFWVDDHLQVSEAIHICFAINLRQGGLVTPAIHDVDMKSWDDLREAVTDLIMRTRAGRLRSSELTDGTITMTSLGDRGVEKVFGVIYPPQVGLVGFGKTIDQPWVENGMLGIRPVLIATVAGDHRATDGHRGALFLEALNKYLQEVEKL
jgi:pyruvate dehydrogenase E2 component (dihydrolipoamide acetyltransferase)